MMCIAVHKDVRCARFFHFVAVDYSFRSWKKREQLYFTKINDQIHNLHIPSRTININIF